MFPKILANHISSNFFKNKLINSFRKKNLNNHQSICQTKRKLQIDQNKKGEDNFVEIFFTKEKFYLDQFYQLRESCFRKDNGWVEYDGSETYFDRNGHILIAKKDDKVVGGVRIIFGEEVDFFSSECPNSKYLYLDYLKTKNESVNKKKLAEISSLVIDYNYRNSILSTEMLKVLYENAKLKKIKFVFSVSTIYHARFYKILCKRGGQSINIEEKYLWKPEKKYSFVQTYLVYAKL